MTSNDVFAQMGVSELIAPQLRNAARAARAGDTGSAMTHAWLFSGPPGSGRSIAAVAFAAALECSNPEVVGCGQCEQCRAVRNGTHGDVVHIVPQELSIAVATMRRDVIEPAATRPTVASWRVVILDNADRLTDGAANALLKTVEEPPKHTVILLCAPSTDPQDVMPTLVSRSRHVYVPQPNTKEVARLLMQSEDVSEEIATLAAAATGNHIGRARRLVRETDMQRSRARTLSLAEDIFRGDKAFRNVTAMVKEITKVAEQGLAEASEAEVEKLRTALGMGASGRGAQKALRGSASQIRELEDKHKKRRTRAVRDALDLALVDLAGLYRDALMKAVDSKVELMHPDFQQLSEGLCQRVSPQGLSTCIEAIMKAREHLGMNVRPETALDAMVGRIRLACGVSE
ncbi:DNA polymerase III subunit delta' [Corynebacterium pseudopelargi]|uniref:DNA polymerase III subunit tau n=1 Tax=Corynebacterium pseudopelargi TaxID=2080757 RepID=A0A3G6IZP6_9CORY|nr:DNA polymerase III subunit delta' [Corynebacterium pseudopelargi]AZA10158.1 DNA polymerase III subunit tau [Corynebacterium pseudopelargi]